MFNSIWSAYTAIDVKLFVIYVFDIILLGYELLL